MVSDYDADSSPNSVRALPTAEWAIPVLRPSTYDGCRSKRLSGTRWRCPEFPAPHPFFVDALVRDGYKSGYNFKKRRAETFASALLTALECLVRRGGLGTPHEIAPASTSKTFQVYRRVPSSFRFNDLQPAKFPRVSLKCTGTVARSLTVSNAYSLLGSTPRAGVTEPCPH